jgi:hypothetical protein
MRKLTMITTIAASALLGTAAMAQTTAGGGVSNSNRNGSTAGGVTAGTMPTQSQTAQDRRAQKRADRTTRRGDTAAPTGGNSSSTYGSGTVYTDRNTATGGVTAGGTATGTGAQSSSTAIDAYGSTTKNGGEAEVYGDTTAKSTPTTGTTTPPRS